MAIYQKNYVTRDQDSALALGSGGLQVLATPALVAFMENAAFVYLEDQLVAENSSVGSQISLEHLAPSKIGQPVQVCILEHKKDGRRHYFSMEAYADKLLIGRANHTRVVIHQEKFLEGLK